MHWLFSAATISGPDAAEGLSVWEILAWIGNVVFGLRFFVQWWATERQKRVVVPVLFWWLSLVGSGLMLVYAVHLRKPALICGYLFNWIPYIRSLVIHGRMKRAEVRCTSCQAYSPGTARFCAACGARVELLAAEQGA